MEEEPRSGSARHAREFASFVVALDDEDIPVVLWDHMFVDHVALLASHADEPNACDALHRLLEAVAARAH